MPCRPGRAERFKGAGELHLRVKTQTKKFGTGDLVAIFQFNELVFHQFMPKENRVLILLDWQQRGCNCGKYPARLNGILIVAVKRADQKPLRPAVDQTGRVATKNLSKLLPMAILADGLARVVDRINAVIVVERCPRCPARVERVERPHDCCGLAFAIIESRLRVGELRPSIESLRVGNLEFVSLAIRVRGARKPDA